VEDSISFESIDGLSAPRSRSRETSTDCVAADARVSLSAAEAFLRRVSGDIAALVAYLDRIGVRRLVLTSAAGSLSRQYRPASSCS